MKVHDFSISGLILIELDVYEDNRGFFLESYNKKKFAEKAGIDVEFVQDNHSRSSKGTLRGLHLQKSPHGQDKLVRVTQGEVYDVAVDLRKGSPTFGKWEAVYLKAAEHKLFFIPKDFLHGFLVLSEFAEFEYKVSNYYSKEDEFGVMWNDPFFSIEWPIDNPILSEKDMSYTSFDPQSI